MGIIFDPSYSDVVKRFNFWEEPFSPIVDTRFIYYSRDCLSLLEQVIENIKARKGITVIEGEKGMGKTILAIRLHEILNQINGCSSVLKKSPAFRNRDHFLIHYINNSRFFFRSPGDNRFDSIKKHLLQRYRANRYEVWILDNAEILRNDEAIDVFKELASLEVNGHSLLQFVLFRRPGLSEYLLPQRNTPTYTLTPLDYQTVKGLVNYRFLVSGSLPLFSTTAIERLYDLSGGVPEHILRIARATLKLITDEKRPFADGSDVISANLLGQ